MSWIKFFSQRSHFYFQFLLLLGFFLLIESISYRNNQVLDFSNDGRYTLTPTTQKILQKIDSPLEIFVFIKANHGGKELVQRMLELFQHHQPLIEFNFVDLDKNPSLGVKFSVENYGVLVLSYQNRVHKLNQFDETSLVAGLLELVEKKTFRILVFSDEHSPNVTHTEKNNGFASLMLALKNEGYAPKGIHQISQIQVTQGEQTVFFFTGRKVDLQPNEELILKKFLAEGGALIALLPAPPLMEKGRYPGWFSFFDSLGFLIYEQLVVDPLNSFFGNKYPFSPLGRLNKRLAATKKIASATVRFPISRPISLKSPKKLSEGTGFLVMSGEGSFGESDFHKAFKGEFKNDGEDLPGPLSLGAVISHPGEKPRIVLGSDQFCNNTNLETLGNRDLILNLFAAVTERENLLEKRGKIFSFQPLNSDANELSNFFKNYVFFLPLGLFLLLGFLRYLYKKTKSIRPHS